MLHPPRHTEKGFTLIETLVIIFVFVLIMGALSSLIVRGYRNYGYILRQSIAVNEARKGIRIMVKEIREARSGDDGSYPIEKAQDKEFIFYSDIDKDDETERIRYFLGSTNSGSETKECVTFNTGGFCEVTFSGFLSGKLENAQIEVSLEGDFDGPQEYAEVFADGIKLGEICKTGCLECAGDWEGTEVFEITDQVIGDGSVQITIDATSSVQELCSWIDPDHSMKAKFTLSWTEEISGYGNEFRRGITEPTSDPIQYPTEQEKTEVISFYVRNSPPIFRYFDEDGQEITETPARLQDTKVIEMFLIINVVPEKTSEQFELKSSVQIRNTNLN